MSHIRMAVDRNRVLENANYVRYAESALHPDRTMKVHDLVYLVQGGWEIWEQKEAFLMQPGDVLILTAGRHHFGRAGCLPDTRTMFIHAYAEEGDAFIQDGPLPDNTDSVVYLRSFTRVAGEPRIRTLFESVVRGHLSSSPTKRAKARVLVSELLIELSALAHVAIDTSASTIDYCVEYMERQPAKLFSIDELATLVDCNRRTFTTRFRARTGQSVHEFQTQLKVRMAASIFDSLHETPIKEVARTLGFYDEFHFSKVFKQHTGLSPSQYKARQAGPQRLDKPVIRPTRRQPGRRS